MECALRQVVLGLRTLDDNDWGQASYLLRECERALED
jgi:hypothetical protein